MSRNNIFSALPVVTKNLLIINIIMWLATWVLETKGVVDLYYYLGLCAIDDKWAQFGFPPFRPWQLITYMFMHGNFYHLLCNMFTLFFFGPIIERTLGMKRYMLFYGVCGVGAGLVQLLVWQLTGEPGITVGASGAGFGILVAFALLYPNMKMYIIPFPFPIKAKWVVLGYALIELAFGVTGSEGSVAHFAHLGGLLFGAAMILYWKHNGTIRNGFFGY